MSRTIHLLIVDPQNDFMDQPAGGNPALPVPGASRDMQRLADLVRRGRDGIDAITVTLDSHHSYDIAHPTFWRTEQGAPVAPFTEITAAQVRAGQYRPTEPKASGRALAYLDALEARGRYRLMVWPVHCEIGSWGHNVDSGVRDAYNAWELHRRAVVAKVLKGSNPWTEHYSAMEAEVPDGADPDTQLNTDLIATLDRADQILIAGEASSHCVRATTEHLARHLPSGRVHKLVLLADCMSPVRGFEAQEQQFLAAMRERGATVTTSTAVLPGLKG